MDLDKTWEAIKRDKKASIYSAFEKYLGRAPSDSSQFDSAMGHISPSDYEDLILRLLEELHAARRASNAKTLEDMRDFWLSYRGLRKNGYSWGEAAQAIWDFYNPNPDVPPVPAYGHSSAKALKTAYISYTKSLGKILFPDTKDVTEEMIEDKLEQRALADLVDAMVPVYMRERS